jgi:rhodanese-related sulfurtransferase
MNRFITAIILSITFSSAVMAATARDISSVEARAFIDKNGKAFILDVRTPQEHSQGYIPGSKLIPIDTIEKRLGEIPKNRPIIVYCAVGSRSRVVAQGLSRSGFPEVYNLRDGIMGWYRSGYPVQR